MLRTFCNLILLLSLSELGLAQPDPTRSFRAQNGFFHTSNTGDVVWMGGGSIDPSVTGVDVPLGSVFLRDNGVSYKKTGALATDWEQAGLESDVVTQTSDFGRSGNASANTFLNRAGVVPSNISGIPIMVSGGRLKSVACGNEDIATYSVEFYQHDGDFLNPILLYTLVVTSARVGSNHTLDIAVTQDKQLAAKTLNAVKNLGCTVAMKGTSL